MICDGCKKKFGKLHIGYYGSYCDECVRGSDERAKKLYAELQAEDPMSMPPMLAVADFERFVLKFAIGYIEKMPAGDKQRLRGTTPMLLQPYQMALHLKDLIVEQIPLNYVSSMNVDGPDRMLYGGTYQFKRLVPDNVIVKAMEKAGLLRIGESGEGTV